MGDDKLTRMLGWASIGLGAPLVLAPSRSARAIGVDDGPQQRAVVAGVGTREFVAAAGLLGQGSPAWLWTRVAGDLMDLRLLGTALRNRALTARVVKAALKQDHRAALNRTIAATGAVAAITGLDLYAAITRSRGSHRRSQGDVTLTAAVTVTQPPHEVYARWRQLESLPTFMAHLDDVTMTSPRTSHWRATAPFSKTVEWDAQITDDVPGERLGWRSLDGSAIRTAGEVRFAPAPGGQNGAQDTEVHVKLSYAVPAGKLGTAIARYFGEDPHQQLDDDLRRFKQVLEVGEVVRSEGAPWGKRARQEFPQHPARPLTTKELAEVRSS
jgi:uncharacterized membrane protein